MTLMVPMILLLYTPEVRDDHMVMVEEAGSPPGG
jgi:hypothetical protein